MKTGWILLTTFVVTFAAGGAVGLLVQSRSEASAVDAATAPKHDKRFDMMDQLNLSEDQRQKVSEIWSGVCRQMREVEQQRGEYERMRDEAIDALQTDEQRAEVQRIRQEFDQHVQQIKEARHKAFEEAKQKTRALLSEEQRVQFDEMMARRKAEYEKTRNEWRGRDGEHGEEGKSSASESP